MYSKAEREQIADTIVLQMGGRMFKAMTGVKKMVLLESGVRIFFKRTNGVKVNLVDIVLNASDTYDMTFMRIHGGNVETISEVDGVYCDMLQDVFEKETGLFVRF